MIVTSWSKISDPSTEWQKIGYPGWFKAPWMSSGWLSATEWTKITNPSTTWTVV